MDNEKIEQLKERFLSIWSSIIKSKEESDIEESRKGKIVVFVVAFILALCLWLMVNLSRDYNLNVNLPIVLGNMPAEQALTEELPSHATVSISGEGWQLINIYNNPPQVYVDVSQNEINLYEQVQKQINANPDLSVQKVQPLFLNLDMESRVTKKIPVVSNVQVTFEDQYNFAGEPVLEPDSVTISGAGSVIRDIEQWETEPVQFEEVESDISATVALKETEALYNITPAEVTYNAKVAQYTEGEVRVNVEPRNMPSGRNVTFSPSFVTIKYNVPVDQYSEVQNLSKPFSAYITYQQIREDSTGFVVPNIENTAPTQYNLNIRSFQPSSVSYFMVLNN
ncbi:MAG: CdaR family protein [Candidatus Halalkalibacterium sp. M3_1C_030]